MFNSRGERIIVDEVDAASHVRNPMVQGAERQRASAVMGRGNKLFHPSGRLIRGTAEASAIMQRSYSANAGAIHAQMRDHELDMNLLHGNSDHSRTRDFAQLLHTAAEADPHTELQDQLVGSANTNLNNRQYDSSDTGGGFVAHEMAKKPLSNKEQAKEDKTPHSQRDPGIPQRTHRNVEFHPPAPGSQHTTQPFGSLHGSYLRPANQPNVKKSPLRAFSPGPRTRGE